MSSQSKPRMTKDIVPSDFTLSLALLDALPLLFFGGSMILVGLIFRSWIFVLGALLCFWAGAAKVIWKIIVVQAKKNLWFLFLQMRIVMPIGFLIMIISIIINRSSINFIGIKTAFLSLPSLIFFIIGIIGMITMGILGIKLDSSKLRSNWIEQSVNAIAQGAIFTGLLLMYI